MSFLILKNKRDSNSVIILFAVFFLLIFSFLFLNMNIIKAAENCNFIDGTWKTIVMSSDGQYQTAITNYFDFIYISNDYGKIWTAKNEKNFWKVIAISSTGQYQTASNSNYNYNNIYTSSDYGQTWINRTTPNPITVADIAISSTGQYQTIVTENVDRYIYTSSDYGQNWIAGGDAGGAHNWSHIAMSSSGQYQTSIPEFGTNGYVSFSNDYGQDLWGTWSLPAISEWVDLAISSDGKYQTVITKNYIYRSSNYGASSSWEKYNIVSYNWTNIAMSSTGQYQTATRKDALNKGYIYISSNYGQNFDGMFSPVVKDNHWWSNIAISSNGQYQTATLNDGTYSTQGVIYISSNYGQTWQIRYYFGGSYWQDIAMSSTGQYQTAVINANIYTSKDYGINWEKVSYRCFPTVSLTGPAKIIIPASIDLNWISTSTQSCSATSAGTSTWANWNGLKMTSGAESLLTSIESTISGIYKFIISCLGLDSSIVSSDITTTLVKPPKCTFSADPPAKVSDLFPIATLRWSCDY